MKTLSGFFCEHSQMAECDLSDQLLFDPSPGEWDTGALVNLIDAFCHSLAVNTNTYLYVRVLHKIAIDVASDKNSKMKSGLMTCIRGAIVQIPALFKEDALPKRFSF